MNNININIEYNYLIDDQICMFPDNYCIDKRRDPDSDSKRLYDDILTIFFSENKSAENLEQQFYGKPKFYTIIINNDTLLSSDYIGPSVYWAREMGVKDKKIRDFLKQCRTIGGHIVWERGNSLKYKVNTSRAGNSGVYDRFDWTLLLLKIFLSDKEHNQDDFIKKANELIPEEFRNTDNTNTKFINLFCAFNCSDWLKEYNFKMFCDDFKLCGSFVDNQYNIKETAPLFPFLPTDYELYIEKTCEAISKCSCTVKKQATENNR